MIGIFIPSKDRSTQLSFLLDSISYYFNNFNDYEINIYYLKEDDEFCDYDSIKEHYLNMPILWKNKNNLYEDLFGIVNTEKYEFIWIITDDSVFINKNNITLAFLQNIYNDQRIAAFSTRAGNNTAYINFLDSNSYSPIQDIEYLDDFIVWPWKTQNNPHFRHIVSIDGNIFERNFLLKLIQLSGWKTTYRAFECELNALINTDNYGKTHCASFIDSILTNIDINDVSSGINNHKSDSYKEYYENINLPTNIINQKKIDFNKTINYNFKSVQQNIPIYFI